LFKQMMARRIPLFVSLRRGMDWQGIYALLATFPDLVCVICDHGCWGMDRMFRPLLERSFPPTSATKTDTTSVTPTPSDCWPPS
jgi:hypothetical protein